MGPVTGAAFGWITAAKAVLFFTLLMVVVGMLVLMERKLAGFIQDRSGPNRVGPWGLLQTLADGLKFALKEETLPDRANKTFFLLAPCMALVPATILFAVIPFAAPLPTQWGLVEVIVADAPVGLLYVLAIASLGVYGIVMAGWSSNSKYPFLGGLRGSAQMISYEVGLAMSLVPILLVAGDVRIPNIVAMQQTFEAGPDTVGLWLALPLLVSFFFFTVAGLAESNRIPFDLPEAEEELTAGYHTEYSAMKFGMFFLGEYAHMLTTAALITVFFLGGWDIPFWAGDNIRVLSDGTVIGEPAAWKTLLTFGAFTLKTLLVVAVFMWIRWTLPRFRYDQLMDLGWKFFIPALMAYIMLIAGTILGLESAGLQPGLVYGAVLFAVNLAAAGLLFFVLDRGRIIGGGAYRSTREGRQKRMWREARERAMAAAAGGSGGSGTAPEGG
ncbi:MAG: NADH-quinone oxidoreductase subunit H [Candidatus Palauibacterales bacterium]|nr:NADH-quinone oxidoreductase subunit H [Candidatus Palauibacterales bacterium]